MARNQLVLFLPKQIVNCSLKELPVRSSLNWEFNSTPGLYISVLQYLHVSCSLFCSTTSKIYPTLNIFVPSYFKGVHWSINSLTSHQMYLPKSVALPQIKYSSYWSRIIPIICELCHGVLQNKLHELSTKVPDTW